MDELEIIRKSLYSKDIKDLERVVKKSRQQWDLLHETLIDYTEGCLSEKQDRYLSAKLVELTSLLFPQGPPATPIEPRRLLYHLIQECRSYRSITALKMSQALTDWVRKTPQPDLSTLLAYKLVNLPADRENDLSPKETAALIPLLKAVLLELCHLPKP